jgi:hypothetical protein
MKDHELAARRAPDWMIEAVIGDLGKRNLRNLRDHETRWCADRSKAFRAERRRRKQAKVYNPIMERWAA